MGGRKNDRPRSTRNFKFTVPHSVWKCAPAPPGATCTHDLRERLKMQTGSITRKVLMNWYALSFTAIFTLGLTGAVGLTTARKTSFHPTAGAPIHDGVGDAPVSVVAGEFNNDGITDLAVANSADNSVSILLGQGDGTFARSSGSAFSTGGNLTTAVAVGDFNNDGKLDVVATDLPGGLSGGIGDIFGSPG